MSRNPLRKLSENFALATMRPPMVGRLPGVRSRRDPIDLRGKRVLLTGASSGIGEAGAIKLAREGATVVVAARRQDLLDSVVTRITDAGGEARAHACDLSDLDAVDHLVATVERELGGIDILINNAGRSIRRPLAESLDRWHDVERTMQLNYYSPLRLIRGLAPGMRERGDGHVINVSSWGVLSESTPFFGPYNGSKAALSAVSRIIDTEWNDDGVYSTLLYYPLVKTPMIAPTRAYDGLPGLSAEEAADWMVTAAKTRPVRIAPRIAVIASTANGFAPAVVNRITKKQRLQPSA